MKKYLVTLFIVLMGFYLVFGTGERMTQMKDLELKPGKQETKPMDRLKADIDFGRVPLYFIANRGQVNTRAKFYAKASRYTLWLTEGGLVFDRPHAGAAVKPLRGSAPKTANQSLPGGRDVSRLVFLKANENPEMVAIEEAELKVNYFIGNDKTKWHNDVPTSMAVLYKDIYKDVDLKVYGLEKQIEYDWIVKPGADPQSIRFEYKNAKNTRIDEEGNLLIETEFGELVHKKPVAYQKRAVTSDRQHARTHPAPSGHLRSSPGGGESFARPPFCPPTAVQSLDSQRVPVEVKFKKVGKNTYGFAVGAYDKSRELIIDPVVLAYSTYLGGASYDKGLSIAVDGSGYAYVAGFTDSANFPALDQYQEYQGSIDVFVTKLDTNQGGAASLLYSTYLGGGDIDYGHGIAVDDTGNAYVMGYTASADFPTLNQYQADQGTWDVFVTKLDTTQSGAASLLYSTYLGGGSTEVGLSIAVGVGGYAYVTGYTDSTDFPTLNQYQGVQGSNDVFVTKLDTTQSGAASLLYSTYLGGGSSENGYGIAVDGSGYAYVTGYTDSTDFPTLNQYQAYQGDIDVFVTKLDTTQSGAAGLLYSTYLGGVSSDGGYGIAVDAAGNAYVTGYTDSVDFPTLNQYQGYQGDRDVFVTRLDPAQSGASSLLYSTYLGGGSADIGRNIAVDAGGYAYVTGDTLSANFPTLNQYQGYQGDRDVFVTRLDPAQSGAACLIYSTYLGGGSDDACFGIAVDAGGNAYVTGRIDSMDFPTLNQYQVYQGGDYDAFVTKLSFAVPGPEINIKQDSTQVANQGSFDFGSSAQGVPVQKIFTIENTGSEDLILDTLPIVISGADAAEFSINTQPTSPVAGSSSTTFTIGFTPTSEGSKTAFISIANNDADENPYEITLTGSSFAGSGWQPVGGMQYNMIVMGTAYNRETLAGEGDWLGAFGPGGDADCRAVAQIEAGGGFYLTVQGDTLSGEQVTFKLWPLPDGPALAASTKLVFIADYFYRDRELHFGLSDISFDLIAGWNWISSNVLPPDVSFDAVFSGIADTIEQVKTQRHSVIRSDGTWTGDLADMNEISSGSMYKIKTDAPCSFTINGVLIPHDTPIPLDYSWNWVAYLPTSSMTVTEATVSAFSILDQVKSQAQSAVKIGGSLIGDLTNMQEGLGYMIKTTDAGLLQYPAPPGAAAAFNTNSIGEKSGGCNPPYTPITGNQYTMIALGQVYAAGKLIDTAGYVVVAFGPGGDTDCRSVSEVSETGAYFTTIRGSFNGETIAFKLYECATGKVYECDETFSFTSDELIQGFDLHTTGPVNTITVTSPNGGEAWGRGTFRDITWDAAGISGNLEITLWRNGVLIGIVATGIDPAAGSFTWQVGEHSGGAAPLSDGYKIRIEETGETIADESDNTFTIKKFYGLALPNGGENLHLRNKQDIYWVVPATFTKPLELRLWKDGALLGVIAQNIAPAACPYSWTVGHYIGGTAPVGTGYKVEVKVMNNTAADKSNAPFTILPPEVTVISPNGGENWDRGTFRDIAWDTSGTVCNLEITLWRDGAMLGIVASGIDPAAGSFTWQVGEHSGGAAPTGDGYKIRIAKIGGAIANESDNSFAIKLFYGLALPNGGENLYHGAKQDIYWVVPATLTKPLELRLWKDGALLGVIAQNIDPAACPYSWTVGNYIGGTAPAGTGYKVEVKVMNNTAADKSNTPFTILPPL